MLSINYFKYICKSNVSWKKKNETISTSESLYKVCTFVVHETLL